MNKGFIASTFVLLLSGVIMIFMSPDMASMLFAAVMCLIVLLGLIMGILPCSSVQVDYQQREVYEAFEVVVVRPLTPYQWWSFG